MCVFIVLCSIRSQREDRSSVARQVLPQEVDDPLVHHHGPGAQGTRAITDVFTGCQREGFYRRDSEMTENDPLSPPFLLSL